MWTVAFLLTMDYPKHTSKYLVKIAVSYKNTYGKGYSKIIPQNITYYSSILVCTLPRGWGSKFCPLPDFLDSPKSKADIEQNWKFRIDSNRSIINWIDINQYIIMQSIMSRANFSQILQIFQWVGLVGPFDDKAMLMDREETVIFQVTDHMAPLFFLALCSTEQSGWSLACNSLVGLENIFFLPVFGSFCTKIQFILHLNLVPFALSCNRGILVDLALILVILHYLSW